MSGLPSTAVALARGDDPLAAARAAGTLLGKPSVVRGAVVHLAISWFWAWAILRLVPRRVAWGAAAGLGIAVLDLGLVARRWFPAVRALPQGPQCLDHLVFGAAVVLTAER